MALMPTARRIAKMLEALGDKGTAIRLNERWQAYEEPALRVVVFGEFNRGKSTLINALLGQETLPAKLIPTTGHVTQIRYGDKPCLRVRVRDGSEQRGVPGDLSAYAILDVGGNARSDVESIVLETPHELLRNNLVLIDTPGICEQAAQTRRAEAAIAEADLVLMVLDARQLLGHDERFLAAEWMTEKLGKPVVPIVNFMNFVSPMEKCDVRMLMDAFAPALRHPFPFLWYEVDARAALRHELGLESSPPSDDFHALRTAISNLGSTERENLKHSSRTAQLLADLHELDAANSSALSELEADDEEVVHRRKHLADALKDRCRKLDRDLSVQRPRLENQIARKLDRNRDILLMKATGVSKEQLESQASAWYADAFEAAIRQAEKEAFDGVLLLADDALPRPEPLTVREELVLHVRIEAPNLQEEDNTGFAACVGAAIGTFIAPGIGSLIGAAAAGYLAAVFGGPPPDYAAAYRKKLEERWAVDSELLQKAILTQFDQRAKALSEEAAQLLAEAEKPLPLRKERRMRLALAGLLRPILTRAQQGV
jgi:hypothetical protein